MNDSSEKKYKLAVLTVNPKSTYTSSSLIECVCSHGDTFSNFSNIEISTELNGSKINLTVSGIVLPPSPVFGYKYSYTPEDIVDMNVPDFQKNFHQIGIMRGYHGFILLCDLSDENTLDKLKNIFDFIVSNYPENQSPSFLIVGDTSSEKESVISNEILSNFSKKNNCEYIPICINEKKNCMKSFEKIGDKIHEDQKLRLARKNSIYSNQRSFGSKEEPKNDDSGSCLVM